MTTLNSLIKSETRPPDAVQTDDQLQEQSAAFVNRLLDILNSGALASMLSIGHRTGLLDTMATLPPVTSQEIAEAAGLNERYVREWLGAMVTGRIVTYDSAHQTYHLPTPHAAFLIRSASPHNMATTMQFIPLVGAVEDAIVDCFYHGGGVPYSAYHHFHRVMAEDSVQTIVAALEGRILPLVPGLTERLVAGITVADIGCGRGQAMHALARLFPKSQFVGYDLSHEVIDWAITEAQRQGLSNVTFKRQDAAQIEAVKQYDLILSFDAIHDQAQPGQVLQNIYRALRADGLYLMQELQASSKLENNLDHPIGPLLYTISCNHCTAVSLAAGGPGLGTMWGKELAIEMLQTAGFTQIEVKHLEHDFQNSYFLAHK